MLPQIGNNNATDLTQFQQTEIAFLLAAYQFDLLIDGDFTGDFQLNSFGLNSIGDISGNAVFKVESLTDDANRTLHQKQVNQAVGVREHGHFNRLLDKVLRLETDPNEGQYLVQGGAIDGDVATGDLCTSWIDTYGITFRGPHNSDKGADPAKPNVTFGKNTYFEIEVNFSRMQTPGFRHSFWLMPATSNVPDRGPVLYGDQGPFLGGPPPPAYDGRENAANGVEIDIYEIEHSPGFEDTLLMKVIAGDIPDDTTNNAYPTSVHPKTQIPVPGINQGWHRIGLLWSETELIWLVDGVPLVRDTELMPNDVRMFLLVTRELSETLYGQDPRTPQNRTLIADDSVMIRNVRVWSVEADPNVIRGKVTVNQPPFLTITETGPRVSGQVSEHFYNRGIWLPIGAGYEARADGSGHWSIQIPAHELNQLGVNAYVSDASGEISRSALFDYQA